jgi:hypothetical protein
MRICPGEFYASGGARGARNQAGDAHHRCEKPGLPRRQGSASASALSDQDRYVGPQRPYKRARAILDREFCVRIDRRALDPDRRMLVDPGNGNGERLAASEFDR